MPGPRLVHKRYCALYVRRAAKVKAEEALRAARCAPRSACRNVIRGSGYPWHQGMAGPGPGRVGQSCALPAGWQGMSLTAPSAARSIWAARRLSPTARAKLPSLSNGISRSATSRIARAFCPSRSGGCQVGPPARCMRLQKHGGTGSRHLFADVQHHCRRSPAHASQATTSTSSSERVLYEHCSAGVCCGGNPVACFALSIDVS